LLLCFLTICSFFFLSLQSCHQVLNTVYCYCVSLPSVRFFLVSTVMSSSFEHRLLLLCVLTFFSYFSCLYSHSIKFRTPPIFTLFPYRLFLYFLVSTVMLSVREHLLFLLCFLTVFSYLFFPLQSCHQLRNTAYYYCVSLPFGRIFFLSLPLWHQV
jgi:hypothetical protein